MIRFRKLIAIFSFFAFLFPFVTEGFHALQHQDEFHRLSSDTHLHKQEHRCNLCDYTPTPSDYLSATPHFFLISFSVTQLFTNNEKTALSFLQLNLAPRAPPTFI